MSKPYDYKIFMQNLGVGVVDAATCDAKAPLGVFVRISSSVFGSDGDVTVKFLFHFPRSADDDIF